MSSLIKRLVFFSFLTLIALSAVQSYLVYNTYILKKNANKSATQSFIVGFYNSDESATYFASYREYLNDLMGKYHSGELLKKDVIEAYAAKTKKLNEDFLPYYLQESQKYLNYPVDFSINVQSLVYNNGLLMDTVYLENEDSTLKLLGSEMPDKEGVLINTSTWENPIKLDGSKYPNFTLVTKVLFNEKQIDFIILKKISGVLIASILLFSFVIGLLYYSIQNLIKQKRNSEIKTDFINNITHEFKTPLATLAVATKTLKRKDVKSNSEISNKTIDIIDRQNQRLQKLLDQVIIRSVGYYQIQLNREEVLIKAFLDDVIDDFSFSTKDKSIEIKKDYASQDIRIAVDHFYFSSAILNILINAVKYEGTYITVKHSISKNKKNILIDISDNGIGIHEEHQNLIFDKFYRVREKDTHNYKGLGLGLYYCNEILKAHGGSLNVTSKIDKGSTFQLSIPI